MAPPTPPTITPGGTTFSNYVTMRVQECSDMSRSYLAEMYFLPGGGCLAGFCITLLGRHCDTLTLCSTHFEPNATLYSTEFVPKSIPYLVQL